MRHLEHLPRYSATFTSIHIVSTLILDVREFILDFFLVFLEYLEILPHSPQYIFCQHCNALILVVTEFFFYFWNIPRSFVGLRMKYSIPLLFQEKTFRFFLFCDFNDRVRQRHEMLMKRKAAWKSHFRTDVPQNCPTRHLPELIVGRHTTMTNCQPPAFSLVVGTFSNFVDKSL